MGWFIGFLVVWWIIQALLTNWGENCPREYIGYSCKGVWCDHSKEEWEHVKEQ